MKVEYDIIITFVASPPTTIEGADLKKFADDELKRLSKEGKIKPGWKLDPSDDTDGATPTPGRGYPGLLFSHHNRLKEAEKNGRKGWITRIPLVKRT